jgi:hypothetical protein
MCRHRSRVLWAGVAKSAVDIFINGGRRLPYHRARLKTGGGWQVGEVMDIGQAGPSTYVLNEVGLFMIAEL